VKTVNFFPFYEEYLRSRKKTTTFRLGLQCAFNVGEEVTLTVGWDEGNATPLHRACIREVYRKRICDLTTSDFDGESPDCRSREATKLVLSSIYRRVLSEQDCIWVVKFDHI
jgi:hypothetical protein